MRRESQESSYRAKQREHYFEDPRYRKWSDITSRGDSGYGNYRERAFLRLYLDCNSISDKLSIEKMHEKLANGRSYHINWDAFYAYFDERMNDLENPYVSEMTEELIPFMDDKISVIDLINQYRDELLSPDYDIV